MVDPSTRALHYDIELERALLGAVLLDGSVIGRLMATINAPDFYNPVHALLWEVMCELARREHPIDVLTVVSELRFRERLNTVGGSQYVGELTDTIVTVAHCETHATLLAGYARARRVREGYAAAIAIMDAGGNPDHYVADAVAVARRSDAEKPVRRRSMTAHMEHAWVRIEGAAEGKKYVTPTGFRGFDGTTNVRGVTGGMHPDQLWVLAADQGFGKTTWAMQVARYVASTGRVVLVFSLEMSGDSLALRMACGDVGVSMQDAVNGHMGQDDITRLMYASGVIASMTTLSIIDDCNTMEEIEAECYAAFARFDVSLIVIDYAQIVRPSKDDARKSTVDQISAVSQGTKRLARRGKCPVLLLSQFSREGQKSDRKPVPTDLKGSGSLESDADVIVFLWQERGQQRQAEEQVKALVAKNRLGDVGDVDMVFQRHLTRFAEADGNGNLYAPVMAEGFVAEAPATRVVTAPAPVEYYVPKSEREDAGARQSHVRVAPEHRAAAVAARPVSDGTELAEDDPVYARGGDGLPGVGEHDNGELYDAVGEQYS